MARDLSEFNSQQDLASILETEIKSFVECPKGAS